MYCWRAEAATVGMRGAGINAEDETPTVVGGGEGAEQAQLQADDRIAS
jgi:hypothetical protein